jgi:hypothetical protein
VFPTSTHPVVPGGVLTGGVTESGTTVTLFLTDAGRWAYSTVQTAPDAPLGESAEWIVEAPTACTTAEGEAVGLTGFGTVAVTGGRPTTRPSAPRRRPTTRSR